jgi:two-component system sensor histidine kinase KdpD
MALVPFRGVTVASNFTFVFVILTIVVAELGGRRAALVTAVVSTLSLDFFLTEPYLKLTIASKHDVVALCGLAVCGAVSAKLASNRAERQRALRIARTHLDLLRAGVRQLSDTDAGLNRLLDALRNVTSIRAVALRDREDRLEASSGKVEENARPIETLRADQLLALPAGPGGAISPQGVRIVLGAGEEAVGSLDVWGSDAPLGGDAGLLLGDLAAILGVRLGRATAGSR